MAHEQVRACDGCKVSDSHAHHVQYAGFVHPITKEPIDLSVSKHIQCCATDGCEVCATDVEFAPVKEIGDDFTAYVDGNKTSEHLTALNSRHGIAVPEGA